MATFELLLFGNDNFDQPLLAEDVAFLSEYDIGDTLTFIGNGESQIIEITDDTDTFFDESQSDQTLTQDVTFGGQTFLAGQIVTPSYILELTGSDGNTYELVSFNFADNNVEPLPDGAFFLGEIPPPGTVLTVSGERNPAFDTSPTFDEVALCFAAGTGILTPAGYVTVETLAVGDKVSTMSHDDQQLRWIGCRKLTKHQLATSPNLRPVRISAGALGAGLPSTDLVVSPQHRILVNSKIVQRMFGCEDVLISAIRLTELPGIFVDESIESVDYYHLLLDNHVVLFAQGAPSESLYLGPQAISAISPDGLEEIQTLFPELLEPGWQPASVCPIPSGHLQKKLVQRHKKNNKDPLSPLG